MMPDSASIAEAKGTPAGEQALAGAFYDWELRGRGWQAWRHAVGIEPAFRPIDFTGKNDIRPDWLEPWADAAPLPAAFLHLPAAVVAKGPCVGDAVFAALQAWTRPSRPVVCEMIAGSGGVRAQITMTQDDIASLPEGLRKVAQGAAKRLDLLHLLPANNETTIAELVLRDEFMIPLARLASPVPVEAVLALGATLAPSELAVMQLLVTPVIEPWASEMLRAALGPGENGLFHEVDDLVAPCRQKIAEPLFAAVLRVAGSAPDAARSAEIARQMGEVFIGYGDGPGNRLIFAESVIASAADLRERISHRSGMILNAAELAALTAPSRERSAVSPPSQAAAILDERVLAGRNMRSREPVYLSHTERLRHLEVTGEALDLLVNFALYDLEHRSGVGVIDTSGELYDAVLRRLPAYRLADVTLLDPARAPASLDLFNVASARERAVLSTDLLATLRRSAPGWSAETDILFSAALDVLLESGERNTLPDLREFLADPVLRARLLTSNSAAARWQERFAAFDADIARPIQRRIDALLESGQMRAILAGGRLPLDFGRILDGGVLLARTASDGVAPHVSLTLAGAVLTKFHQAIAAGGAGDRPPFFLYVNGADRVLLPAMRDLFAAARRANVGLVLVRDAAVSSLEGTDFAWRGHSGLSAVFQRKGRAARFRLGEENIDVEIAAMPLEPVDAFRRVQDAHFVSARRHGLIDPVPLSAGARIARQSIGQADARRRPAFLSPETP